MKLKEILDTLKIGLLMLAPKLKKKDSKVGNKELIEGMMAAGQISAFMAARFQDGADLGDGWALVKKMVTDEDPDFKTVVEAGYKGANKIPAEVKDLDAGEAMEVTAAGVDVTHMIVAALAPKPKSAPAPAAKTAAKTASK